MRERSTGLHFLPLADIRTDGGTQMREGLNEAAIRDYGEAMADGWGSFPPLTVYFDGKEYWLADGFHRLEAARRQIAIDSPITLAPALVTDGTRRDAVLFAAQANATHGLQRSSGDKRRAVLSLLGDAEWQTWSDREIARRCRVNHHLVAEIRASMGDLPVTQRTYTTKHGTVATMRVQPRGASEERPNAHNNDYAVGMAAGSGAGGQARCRRCKRALTDDESIAQGIGPCCRNKVFANGDGDVDDGKEESFGFELEAMEPETPPETPHSKPHLARSTGDVEWHTPGHIIERARRVMGEIDLDPASNVIANKTVQARQFYSQADDGLQQDWFGRVWLNPPYSNGLMDKFIDRLASAVQGGAVTEAIVLVNNATETQWFRRLMEICAVLCLPTGRIWFYRDSTAGKASAPLQGQAIIYVGENSSRFAREFGDMGVCLILYRHRRRLHPGVCP